MTTDKNQDKLKQSDLLLLESENIIPEQFHDNGYFRDGILISICVKGSIKIQANLQDTTMVAADLLVLLPQSIVNVGEKSPDASFISLLFRFDMIADLILPTDYNFLKTILHTPIIQLDQSAVDLYIRYIDLLKINIVGPSSIFQGSVIQYLLFSLIGQINIFYRQNEAVLHIESKKDRIVFQFYNLVHQYYISERSVTYYADRLKLTPKYLTTLIRLRTGRAISVIIIELVIIKAKSYLSASDLSTYQIAELLHFSDSSTFCRYFKKYTGLSPQTYRGSTR